MRIENIAVQAMTPEQAGVQNGMLTGFAMESVNQKDDETKILKAVQAGGAGYNKNDFQGAASQEDIALAIQNELNASNVKDEMNALGDKLDSNSKEDVEKLGFSLESAEARQINTATDKIMMQLALAGVDISAFGAELSDIQIKSITGNSQVALAVHKAQEVTANEGIGENSLAYLLKNDMEPTIDNLYKAKYSGSTAAAEIESIGQAEYDKLRPEVEKVIYKAGLEVSEETVAAGKWMLERNVELTPEHMALKVQFDNGELIHSDQEIANAIVKSISCPTALIIGVS